MAKTNLKPTGKTETQNKWAGFGDNKRDRENPFILNGDVDEGGREDQSPTLLPDYIPEYILDYPNISAIISRGISPRLPVYIPDFIPDFIFVL